MNIYLVERNGVASRYQHVAFVVAADNEDDIIKENLFDVKRCEKIEDHIYKLYFDELDHIKKYVSDHYAETIQSYMIDRYISEKIVKMVILKIGETDLVTKFKVMLGSRE